MDLEQILINKWRILPTEKQQEVIDFVNFLDQQYSQKNVKKLDNIPVKTKTLEGKLIYYEQPYEPVALDDWEVMM